MRFSKSMPSGYIIRTDLDMLAVSKASTIPRARLHDGFTMRTALALYLLTLAALTAAVPHLSYTFQVKETVTPPREWSQAYKAPSDLTIDLRIALPQQNFALLEQHLYEVR